MPPDGRSISCKTIKGHRRRPPPSAVFISKWPPIARAKLVRPLRAQLWIWPPISAKDGAAPPVSALRSPFTSAGTAPELRSEEMAAL